MMLMHERRPEINNVSAKVVLLLSSIALLAVLSGFTQPPQTDEGAAAHIFQLSIVALGPAVLLFIATAGRSHPLLSVRPLVLPAAALTLAFAALYYLEHYRDPHYVSRLHPKAVVRRVAEFDTGIFVTFGAVRALFSVQSQTRNRMIARPRHSEQRIAPLPRHVRGTVHVPEGDLLCSIQRDVTEPLFDENYLQALARRDADAENFLVAHFSRPVQSKLRVHLRSADLIQDARQETLLRVLRYFHQGKTLDNPHSLPGFVHSVCHNVALEFLRSHTRHPQMPENGPDTVDPGCGPEAQAMTEERRKMVEQVLSEMPEKDRILIRRVCLDEEDKDKVCEEFQVDRDYLRVLLYRARIRFRAVIAKGEGSKGFSANG